MDILVQRAFGAKTTALGHRRPAVPDLRQLHGRLPSRDGSAHTGFRPTGEQASFYRNGQISRDILQRASGGQGDHRQRWGVGTRPRSKALRALTTAPSPFTACANPTTFQTPREGRGQNVPGAGKHPRMISRLQDNLECMDSLASDTLHSVLHRLQILRR